MLGTAARVGLGEGRSRGGPERAEDVAFGAPAVIDFLSGPTGRMGLRLERLAARIALGAHRSHFVQADDKAPVWGGRVERLDLPLFSANAGSTRAPNQVSCLRDRKSTRLNSSHANISYAVFCLKKNLIPLIP